MHVGASLILVSNCRASSKSATDEFCTFVWAESAES